VAASDEPDDVSTTPAAVRDAVASLVAVPEKSVPPPLWAPHAADPTQASDPTQSDAVPTDPAAVSVTVAAAVAPVEASTDPAAVTAAEAVKLALSVTPTGPPNSRTRLTVQPLRSR
jgi:hypothetical protein